MKRLSLILYFLIFTICSFAQTDTANEVTVADTAIHPRTPGIIKKEKRPFFPDTLKKRMITDTINKSDSLVVVDSVITAFTDTAKTLQADTAKNIVAVAPVKKPADSIYFRLFDNPFTRTQAKPIYLVIDERKEQSKDKIFYLLSGLLLFLAFIKLVFSRYFKNVFRLFFQPSFRQKQTREQLLQNNLPALLLNLFFLFSGAVYISFLLQYYHLTHIAYWPLLLYTLAFLVILYVGKYLLLKFSGWVFDVKESANAYIFSVYLINKILGVILIPFSLLIAFSSPPVISICITISFLIIILLYLYRYMVSYAPVRKQMSLSVLHFLLYIFAFEITPLLIIYKTLIIYMNKSL